MKKLLMSVTLNKQIRKIICHVVLFKNSLDNIVREMKTYNNN